MRGVGVWGSVGLATTHRDLTNPAERTGRFVMSNQPLTKVVVVIVECDGAVRCERWTPTEGSLLEPLSKAVGGLIGDVHHGGTIG